jgi:hypothetical protein
MFPGLHRDRYTGDSDSDNLHFRGIHSTLRFLGGCTLNVGECASGRPLGKAARVQAEDLS